MRTLQLHPLSLLAGFAVAAVAFVTMGQKTAPTPGPTEYKIVDDVDDAELKKLADGWEFVGYLGQGTKGSSNDQTLWCKRAK